ncbi:uncharacterized protein PAC_18286 [Phialocephala subalpina]|uniref:Uncharacterized protein n=1 Tax=Phialocephala subalpina TaxID=576137 RepID=A0A1L7XTT8_9HELO|nr:uncharacterized protein PAC_18286 [Phialocephala subalpina]
MMSLEPTLGNTTCSKGHIHPPWNTTGVLRIAKCESVCGFCQKETKTAANLRKHVAIHIKNEGLNLTIAEGSSGRGRLEMPSAQLERGHSSSSRFSQERDDEHDYKRAHGPSTESFSASSVLMSMSQRSSYPGYTSSMSSYPSYTYSSPSTPGPVTAFTQSMSHSPHPPSMAPYAPPQNHGDPFRALREHNISTKSAWTVIPAAEGFRILDMCKSMSIAREGSRGEQRVPCYNRETIFDEEWQTHMKDVHGVFLLWPETWMRRIEVLDLDAFGGDIGACNEVIMDS